MLFVHAHPDDETTKGGCVAAWLADNGTRTVLVTCTDGSAGDVTDPALVGDRPLAEVRSAELAAACEIMGFAAVHELGYADSGVDAQVADGFANLALDQVVPRLVEIIHAERPDVIVTYEPAYAKSHPDHRQTHDITAAAFEATRDQPGGPRKLYGTRFYSEGRVRAMHQWMIDKGRKSPYRKALETMGERPTERFTTRIDIGDHALTARRALQQHRTQIAQDHRWFYSIPEADFTGLYPFEDLELIATATDVQPVSGIETDLFAGL